MQKTILVQTIMTEDRMVALRNGDHEAFQELFYAYSESVQRFLHVLLGSAEAAGDITQDVFATVWEKRHLIDPCRSIKAYLFTIAKHAAFRYIRTHRQYFDLTDDLETEMNAPDEPTDALLIARETELLVEIAVSRMPKLRCVVYKMSREDHLRNDEIARTLGISKESVASHLYNALKDIKEMLALFVLLFVE